MTGSVVQGKVGDWMKETSDDGVSEEELVNVQFADEACNAGFDGRCLQDVAGCDVYVFQVLGMRIPYCLACYCYVHNKLLSVVTGMELNPRLLEERLRVVDSLSGDGV